MEYTYEFAGLDRVVKPIGVCHRTGSSVWPSEMLVCNGENKVLEVKFDDENCEDADYSRDFRESIDHYNVTSYSVTCCTGNVCPYGIQTEYETTSCSEDRTGIDYDEEEPYIISNESYACFGDKYSWNNVWDTKKFISCNNGELVYEELIGLGHKKTFYEPTMDRLPDLVSNISKNNDMIITLGAGTIWRYAEKIVNNLKANHNYES